MHPATPAPREQVLVSGSTCSQHSARPGQLSPAVAKPGLQGHGLPLPAMPAPPAALLCRPLPPGTVGPPAGQAARTLADHSGPLLRRWTLTLDVFHLALGDGVKVKLHERSQEVGVGHHALGRLPVELLVALHDEEALTHRLHLLWRLGERPGPEGGRLRDPARGGQGSGAWVAPGDAKGGKAPSPCYSASRTKEN